MKPIIAILFVAGMLSATPPCHAQSLSIANMDFRPGMPKSQVDKLLATLGERFKITPTGDDYIILEKGANGFDSIGYLHFKGKVLGKISRDWGNFPDGNAYESMLALFSALSTADSDNGMSATITTRIVRHPQATVHMIEVKRGKKLIELMISDHKEAGRQVEVSESLVK